MQADPTPHPGVDSIGSNDPPRFHCRTAKDGAITGQAGDRGVPKQSDSTLLCPFHHFLVEDCSPYANTAGTGKARFRRGQGVYETDSSKDLPVAWTNRHA
jgi:hypothetical protein